MKKVLDFYIPEEMTASKKIDIDNEKKELKVLRVISGFSEEKALKNATRYLWDTESDKTMSVKTFSDAVLQTQNKKEEGNFKKVSLVVATTKEASNHILSVKKENLLASFGLFKKEDLGFCSKCGDCIDNRPFESLDGICFYCAMEKE